MESLRTSFGGAGVEAAGASATLGAGSIAPVLGGLGLVGVAGAAGMDPVALAECVGLMFCVAASFANSLWITLLTSSNPIFPITKGSLLSSTDFIIRLKLN